MNLRNQKNLAARTLKVSPKRVKFRAETEEDVERIKNILTREDVKGLFEDGLIVKLPKRGISRTRANYILKQKKLGRRRGYGSRRGTKKARAHPKKLWMKKIRALRKLLRELRDRDKLEVKVYRMLYRRAKANYFRGKKHLLMFIEQNELWKKKEVKE